MMTCFGISSIGIITGIPIIGGTHTLITMIPGIMILGTTGLITTAATTIIPVITTIILHIIIRHLLLQEMTDMQDIHPIVV